MLSPKSKVIRSYHYCFYGRAFCGDAELDDQIDKFVTGLGMEIYPLIPPGEWMWAGLTSAMHRSAFCIFETESANKNAHIELGYALARRLRVALLIREDSAAIGDITRSLPSDLAGLIQIRYRSTGELVQMLSKSIPRKWYSVEERLGDLLRGAGSLDRAYFWCLLQEPRSFSFLDLAKRCHCVFPNSSEMTLAAFLNSFDEALTVEGATPPESYPRIPLEPTTWSGTVHQMIRIDEDYRSWISAALAIEPGQPFPE